MNFTEAKKTISYYTTDDLQDAVRRLKKSNPQPSDGASWLPHRFNIVPFGGPGNGLPAEFVDSLAEAREVKRKMLKKGATDVRIYDTVDGAFHNPHPHHSPTPESLAARVALAAAAPTGMAVVTAAEIVDMVDRGVVDEAAEVVIDAVEGAGELIGSPVGDVVEDVTEEVEAMVSNPKLVGHHYSDIGAKLGIDHLARPVRISFSQARLLPPGSVGAILDTSDRGSKGSFAKRWYRWYADADTIRQHDKSTAKMRAKTERTRNPEPAASALYESFHGTPSTETVEVAETIHEHEHLATLGILQSVKIHTPTDKRLEITFESDQPFLASNETGTQLYIVGGDQAVDLKSLGLAGKKWYRDCMLLGVLEEVTYRTKKGFHNFKLIDYFHKLGEETGVEPVLAYDTLNQKFSIIGGQYRVKPEGIVN